MTAPENEYAFDFEIAAQAAENWYARETVRDAKIEALNQKRYTDVESKERLAKRVNRRLEKVRDALPPSGTEGLSDTLREFIERDPLAPEEIDDITFERVMGETRDFLSSYFLERGAMAMRSIGRIVTDLGNGRRSFGTGFLVSPSLLLTNQHVLRSAQQASRSIVEFNYQLDPMTREAAAVQRFRLAPERFFLNDRTLDFALVAVDQTSSSGKPLSDYGVCPLIKEQGKISVGECVNIIQHPRGEMKQIVIRENKLADIELPDDLAHLLHYMGDTEPGSSGSAAFNDEWEVAALHHSSVPKRNERGEYLTVDGGIWRQGDDPSRLAWVANEGIRISYIVDFIEKAEIKPHERNLRTELLSQTRIKKVETEVVNNMPENNNNDTGGKNGNAGANYPAENAVSAPGAFQVTMTGPVNITIHIGANSGIGTSASAQGAGAGVKTVMPDDQSHLLTPAVEEAIRPDPNYSNRPGYDAQFLGFPVPLPRLGSRIRPTAFRLSTNGGANPYEIKYHHFSVIMNQRRKIAIVAAVNFDAGAQFRHPRDDRDRWFVDPRVGAGNQTGENLYAANPYDRGHLVRRADAAWGRTREKAKLANDDTFHFTNCSPQHEVYNQATKANDRGVKLWGNIEEHIASQGRRVRNKKVVVMNGAVFRDNDPVYRNIQIPREYWKVVVFANDQGSPTALAFRLSQENLIREVPEEDFTVGEYRPFQVKLSDLEMLTNLNFGNLRNYDPLENDENENFLEFDSGTLEINNLENIVF